MLFWWNFGFVHLVSKNNFEKVQNEVARRADGVISRLRAEIENLSVKKAKLFWLVNKVWRWYDMIMWCELFELATTLNQAKLDRIIDGIDWIELLKPCPSSASANRQPRPLPESPTRPREFYNQPNSPNTSQSWSRCSRWRSSPQNWDWTEVW